MLNHLRLIRNVGIFDSVSTGASIPLAQMTLGYAENGRGKTTLAAIFRSLSTGDPIPISERRRLGAAAPPHIVIDCTGGPPAAIFNNGAWNRQLSDVFIFDDYFVDQNIYSGLAIDAGHKQKLHELILGSQGVALNQALQRHVATIEALNGSLRNLGSAIPELARFGVPVEDFCALPVHPAIEEDIQEAERALSAAGQQEVVRTTKAFELFALPTIDVDAIRALLGRELAHLDQTATNRVQQHFAALGRGAEAWVADGIERIPGGLTDPKGKPCPFCAQDLAASQLVGHYRSYFAAEYSEHKQAIDALAGQFASEHSHEHQLYLTRVIHQLQGRRDFWSQFAELPEIDLDAGTITEAWTSMRDAVSVALEAKKSAPLDRIDLSTDAIHAIEDYREKATKLTTVISSLQQANPTIARVKELAAAANAAAMESDLQRLRAIQSRHSAAVAPLCGEYLMERANKTAAEAARDAARVALDNYRTNIFPTYQDAINDCLQRFNAGFRLTGVSSQNNRGGSSCTYSVLINSQTVPMTSASPMPGMPSFKSTLSAGDRNTLALAIFFASLEQDPALANKIVVIDDPVSSLDDHRSLTTVHELSQLSQRVSQVVVLSHSKSFLCGLWEATDSSLRSAFTFDRAPVGSTIRTWDVNQDLVTDHDRRHKLLRDFVAGENLNKREVAQALRPTLEAFFRVARPENFPPGTLLGPFRGLCEQRVGTPNEILNQAEIDELWRLTDYGNRFHHDTNPAYLTQAINDSELLNFTKRTLAFAVR